MYSTYCGHSVNNARKPNSTTKNNSQKLYGSVRRTKMLQPRGDRAEVESKWSVEGIPRYYMK